MPDNPDTRPKEIMVPVSDTAHAPFVFYEIPLPLVSQMELSTSHCRRTELGSDRTTLS
jgi:hypothetical protein